MTLYRRLCRWFCSVADHSWRRELLDDGCVCWTCERCIEPPRLVGDRAHVDYEALPDLPPKVKR